jgi:hypothetical protein
MTDIRRRLKTAEEKLNLNEEHITVNIVSFSGVEPPPDRTGGNITVHYVTHEEKARQ